VSKAHVLSLNEMAIEFVQDVPEAGPVENVKEHLQSHFLHPAIHVSKTIRNLLKLSDDVLQVSA